ncbi:uncharacterized protein LOC121372077 [Gigantopelta aegis]|uniref:uncharacterized protein LOC121372077 n=1 Tax=Gigantopelta aegis TaxID=1735272 RepID=UPI001B88D761|nr:uncharacterized protein LOC121372077 [Gigantopelta aegis]
MPTEKSEPLPDVNSYGGYEELVSLVTRSPTSQGPYRCPVSTPSNSRRPDVKARRRLVQNSPPPLQRLDHKAFIVRSLGMGRRRSRESRGSGSPQKNVGYYFVDKSFQTQEAALTNSFWLKSLCAQPVEEILGKYRRKSDFQRTKLLWSKTFSTPGEQAILSAWETNTTFGVRRPTTMNEPKKGQYRELTLSQEVKVSSAPSARPNRDAVAVPDDNDVPPPASTPPGFFNKENEGGDMRKVRDTKTPSLVKCDRPPPAVKAPLFSLMSLSGKPRRGHRVQTNKYLGSEDRGASLLQARCDQSEILGLMPSPAPSSLVNKTHPVETKEQKGVKLPHIGRKDK